MSARFVALSLVVLNGLFVSFAADALPRFRSMAQLATPDAAWISVSGRDVAFGRGHQLHLARWDDGLTPVASAELPVGIEDAVLAGGKLWAAVGGELAWIDPADPGRLAGHVALDPPLRGRARLVRYVADLLLLEDGVGLRTILLPRPLMPGSEDHGHHFPHEPRQGALLALNDEFTAAAPGASSLWAATRGGSLYRIDLSDLEAPRLERRHVLPQAAPRALAASGDRLYLLGEDGLRIAVAGRAAALDDEGLHEQVRGTSIAVAGRRLLVGGPDGLQEYADRSAIAATHTVNLGAFFFDPAVVTVNSGDAVVWNNTGGTHNVTSCTTGRTGCPGPATEAWSCPTSSPTGWNCSKVYGTAGGSNPYTCTVTGHAGQGMTGTVNVNAAVPKPPAVPDGGGTTTPMTVRKQDAAGATLIVAWDDAACAPDAADNQILYGDPAGLPNYTLQGARCAIGTTSPFTWSNSPAPAPGSFTWWVVVATDGSSTEGSWGQSSAGAERHGSQPSGQCGANSKDTSNACGN
ncbi:MAG: hypothetical protein KBD01_18705 [Acidobacteria bacterium]|nr:hypothetical protein [Acidobacteriota bacterium]